MVSVAVVQQLTGFVVVLQIDEGEVDIPEE